MERSVVRDLCHKRVGPGLRFAPSGLRRDAVEPVSVRAGRAVRAGWGRV